ncbi:unnamed protein product [Arabidopsis arenosa]|uniref:Uncharacterized protein n=1 Tax=Arabidopsis arenosa TaxID=38785 RepID=A0A8S2B3K4_ARAAE|nr:unnamed protein product [Arabidopsis arenosa]
MSRKFTYAEKGKRVASSEAPPRSELPPRIPRVRVPAFDDSELRRLPELEEIPLLPGPPPKKPHREAEDSKKRSQDRPHDVPQHRTPHHSGTKRTRSPDHREIMATGVETHTGLKTETGIPVEDMERTKVFPLKGLIATNLQATTPIAFQLLKREEKQDLLISLRRAEEVTQEWLMPVPIQIPGSSLLLQRRRTRDLAFRLTQQKAQREEKDIDKQKILANSRRQLNRWLVKSKKRVTGKKKLGRPPGKKNVSQKNPKIPLVGSGKRRRTLHPVPSPRRRLNMDSYLEGAEEDATLNAGPSSGPLHVPTEARARASPPSLPHDFLVIQKARRIFGSGKTTCRKSGLLELSRNEESYDSPAF